MKIKKYFQKLGDEITGKRNIITGKKPKQNTKTNPNKRFVGSVGWLIFWIVMFWPIAVVYYFCNYEK